MLWNTYNYNNQYQSIHTKTYLCRLLVQHSGRKYSRLHLTCTAQVCRLQRSLPAFFFFKLNIHTTIKNCFRMLSVESNRWMCQNDIVHLFTKRLMVDTVGLQYSNQWKNKKLINPLNPTPYFLIFSIWSGRLKRRDNFWGRRTS